MFLIVSGWSARLWLRRSAAVLCLLAGAAGASGARAADCDGAQRIRLRTPVELSAQERTALQSQAPLRILVADTPPMMRYDPERLRYSGIGADVLCFLAGQTGLRYTLVPEPQGSVAEKMRRVQQGDADVFVPLSRTPERERKGLFSQPFYESHYGVIARKGRRLSLGSSDDLARLRVGVVQGVALEPILRGIVPAPQLHSYPTSVEGQGLFEALRSGAIDVAVFNRDFFLEKRYQHELFDLEVVHTLTAYPRAYGFYFSPAPHHQPTVALLDRYLAAMDISASLEAHEVGERQMIERYVAQRSQRSMLLLASVVAVLLALASYAAMRHHRSLALRLRASHAQALVQQQALERANAELERLSQTDGLTRLANRRHFDRALAREHARHQRTGAPLSLLMVDIDHFKRVNDHYGHAMGDDYLRAVARALERDVARATDVVARYGGEEFVCLLPDTDLASAQALAEHVRTGIAELQLPNAQADIPYLTVSIGVATLAGGEHSAQALAACADTQLYAAKQAGRNRVCSALLAASAPAG